MADMLRVNHPLTWTRRLGVGREETVSGNARPWDFRQDPQALFLCLLSEEMQETLQNHEVRKLFPC